MSFSRYNTEDSVISSETVVRGLWSGDTNTLTQFFTSSSPTEYYVDVYNIDPSSNYKVIHLRLGDHFIFEKNCSKK